MRYLLLGLALELPALMAFTDCWNRKPADFPDGERDRRGWLTWLWVAVATSWLLVGYAIVLSYYYGVVKRRAPLGRG